VFVSHISIRVAAVLLPLFFLTACQKAKQTTPSQLKAETTAVASQTPSWMHAFKTPVSLKEHSSFYSLENPSDAFAARLHLIDKATTSIDVQYYIYKDDLTANEFTYRLVKAADRGVKVRILIDDLDSSGKDRDVAILASHPNIDIKLFNPNRFRFFFRNIALFLNVETLGKRMHNKTFIVDGKAAIIGGRNIGDEYFDANAEVAFLDYDILAVGKIVPETYKQFDIYWNSPLSVDYSKLIDIQIDEATYRQTIAHITQLHHSFQKTLLSRSIEHSAFMKHVQKHHIPLYTSKEASLYFDLPKKIVSDPNDRRTHLSSSIDRAIDAAKDELIIISPYFIPSPEMINNFKLLRKQNVSVTVITNSMASTDVAMVYSGYKKYIRPLLEMGVNIYELKPYLEEDPKRKKEKKKKRDHISLHTKMIIVDTDQLIVGSANMDPRSDKLNTEVLMLIKKSPLIPNLKKKIGMVLNKKHFYQLKLMKRSKNSKGTRIVWETIENDEVKYFRRSPDAGAGRRIGVDLFSLLPIEGYL